MAVVDIVVGVCAIGLAIGCVALCVLINHLIKLYRRDDYTEL